MEGDKVQVDYWILTLFSNTDADACEHGLRNDYI